MNTRELTMLIAILLGWQDLRNVQSLEGRCDNAYR